MVEPGQLPQSRFSVVVISITLPRYRDHSSTAGSSAVAAGGEPSVGLGGKYDNQRLTGTRGGSSTWKYCQQREASSAARSLSKENASNGGWSKLSGSAVSV